MYFLFNALLLPFYPALGVYVLWRRYVKKRSAASVRGMLGFVPADVVEALRGGQPIIWLHSVSVGETMAARPVAKALKAALPNCRIGLSVTTDTGFETAQGAKKAGEVDATFYFPLDLPPLSGRALRAINPDVFLVMETELWPNFLHIARRRGTKTVLVNGRVSDRMQQNVPKLKPFWRWTFSNLDGALLRSATDEQRFVALTNQLGAKPGKIQITGDVKLDAVVPAESGTLRQAARAKWREIFGVAADARLVVAGSTHPGEEEMLLSAVAELKPEFPDLRLVLAPRHIERGSEVAQIIEAHGETVLQRTQTKNGVMVPNAIGLLDTVGELADLYAAADVTFVGGSLIERGGHNMLEPVLRGVPVLFGPYVMNFRDSAKMVEESGVGTQVANAGALSGALAVWLRDAAKREAVPQKATEALSPHRGATQRVAQFVADLTKA